MGDYRDALGNGQALLVTEAAGRWRRAVQAQPPAGSAVDPFAASRGGGLTGISCPAAGECAAAGRYVTAGGTVGGALFQERRGRWPRGVRLALPANALRRTTHKHRPAAPMSVNAIACGSPGNCVAVGNYETVAEVLEPLIAVERSGRWQRAIEAPLPPGAAVAGQNATLLSVACAPSGGCSAAGDYIDTSGHQQALLVSGSGRRWAPAPAPVPPSDASGDPSLTPSAIACPVPGACAVVGTYLNPLANSLGLLLSQAGGIWQGGVGAALPAGAAPAGTFGDQAAVLSSVACPQAGECTAVGWYFDNYGNSQGLIVSQHDGVWQPGTEVKLPTNAVTGLNKQSSGVDWISCASVGNCLATGVYTDIGYNSQGLLIQESGGVWQPATEAPLPRGAATAQSAATVASDCTAPSTCTVIGDYDDASGNLAGFMLTENAGRFGRATELLLPPATAAEVRLSLAAILLPSGPAAQLGKIRSARRYVYTYRAVEPGTAASSWYATVNGSSVLIAAGRTQARAAGATRVDLRLTPAGEQLLAGAGVLRVSVRARFTPRGNHGAQQAQASFTLR